MPFGSRAALRSGLCYFWGLEIRVFAYVDGFNFYYSALKGTPYRWLNLAELSKRFLNPPYTLERLKYFTARVSGAGDPGAPKRQQAYLDALGTVPEVEVHFGSFLSKTIWRPVVNLPVAGATIASTPPTQIPPGAHSVTGGSLIAPATLKVATYPVKPPPGHRRKPKHKKTPIPTGALVAEVHTMEEKGSDVNLAAHILNDAWKNLFDAALVFSNDSDLVTPLRMVSVERGKPIATVSPARNPVTSRLRAVSNFQWHAHPADLLAAQFPDPIPGTTIMKPASW